MKPKLFRSFIGVLAMAGMLSAGEVIERKFSVGAEPRLIIDVDPSRLTVEVGDNNVIALSIQLPEGNVCNVHIEQAGDKITLTLNPEGTLGLFMQKLRIYEVDIHAQVPADCDVVLITQSGRVEVRGVGGEIRSHSGSKVGQVIRWIFRIDRMNGKQANGNGG